MKMPEILKEVESTCLGSFVTEDPLLCAQLNLAEDLKRLFLDIARPESNISWWRRWSLRKNQIGIANFLGESKRTPLIPRVIQIYHFPINSIQAKQRITDFEKSEAEWQELKTGYKSAFTTSAGNQRLKEFRLHFFSTGCIYTNIGGESVLTGPLSTTKEVADFLKLEGPRAAIHLLHKIIDPFSTFMTDNESQCPITIYDLVQDPREVYLIPGSDPSYRVPRVIPRSDHRLALLK